MYGPSSATGTFIALVVTANATSGSCLATFTLIKKGSAGVTSLWTSTVNCLGDNNTVNPILVSRDGNLYVYNWSRT